MTFIIFVSLTGNCVEGLRHNIAPLNCLLSLVASGSTWPRATQDHRILSSDCILISKQSASPSRCAYLVALGDSRGIVTVGKYYDGINQRSGADGGSQEAQNGDTLSSVSESKVASQVQQLAIVDEVQVSECPILSSTLVLLNGTSDAPHGKGSMMADGCVFQYILGIFGDTSGQIWVWLIKESVMVDGWVVLLSFFD